MEPSVWLAPLTCLVIFNVTSQAIGQELEFHFNPPDGITYTETLKTTKVKDMGSFGKQTDIGEVKSSVSIKRTSNGYAVTVTPVSMTMTRNRQVVNNPTTPILLDTVVTYDLDANGQLLAIQGYETLLERIQRVFPPAAAQSLSAMFSEDAIVHKETAERNGRIGSYIGRVVKIGEVVNATEEFSLPTGGTVVYYSTTKFVEQTKCGGHDCVRIQFFYNTDANALAELVGTTVGEIAKAVDASEQAPGVSGVEIVGGGERLIDPATMLIYSESVTRTMKMLMDVPGQEKTMTTVQEKREYSFDYPN